MHFLLTLFCFSISLTIYSQTDPVPMPTQIYGHPLYAQARALHYDQEKYAAALPLWKALISRYPEDSQPYSAAAMCEMVAGDYTNAFQHAQYAVQLYPLDGAAYGNMGLLKAVQKDPVAARHYLKIAAELSTTAEVDNLLYNLKAYADYYASSNYSLSDMYKSLHRELSDYFTTVQGKFAPFKKAYEDAFMAAGEGKANEAATLLQSTKAYFTSDKFLDINAYYFMVWNTAMELPDPQAAPWFMTELNEGFSKVTNMYLKSKLFSIWAMPHEARLDYEKVISQAKIILDDMAKASVLSYAQIELYIELCRYYNHAKKPDSRPIALELIRLENQYADPRIRCRIFLSACASLHESKNPADVLKAIEYGEIALAIAREQKFDQVTIKSALMVAYSNSGQAEKAAELQKDVAAGIHRDALEDQITKHSNQAILFANQQKLTESAASFEKAIALLRQKLNTLSPAEKLPYMANRGKIFIDVASIYSELGRHDKVLATLEEARNQHLAHSLGLAASNIASVAEIQATLGTDEALIYYNWIAETGFLYTVVTKTSVTSGINDPYYIFGPIKANMSAEMRLIENNMAQDEARAPSFVPAKPSDEQVSFAQGDINIIMELYRDMIQKGGRDAVVRTKSSAFAHMMYTAFMKPLMESLNGKKHLIFILDGALNYIPFETFWDRDNNQLLVEKFDVSYAPSATVLRGLRARQYPTTRKPILAMGGALYREGENKSSSLRSSADIERLREKVLSDVAAGKSILPSFRAFGYDQLSYLQGTLQEVEDIRAQIPGSVVLTGEQMQESTVKEMSNTNKLQEYKVLHFATHGWVNNIIPQLSGIAFCTYAEGKNGQDGFLLLPEIAKLKCKADLVMLSACQTGLGKAYGSEGIYGLPQAFFIAGANGVIASLWPVDDRATSILGAQVYKLVNEKNISYEKALNEVKRQFIRGDHNKDGYDFTAPVYWSPFIYNGK